VRLKPGSVLAKEIGNTNRKALTVFQLNYKSGFWGKWVDGFFWLIQVLYPAILILKIGICNSSY
jgi:hypothetical protein